MDRRGMWKWLPLLLLGWTLLAPVSAAAQSTLWVQPTTPTKKTIADIKGGGAFGLGFTAGSRSGMTMKIWPALGHGIVIDIGAPRFLNSLALALGYRGHFKPLMPPSNAIAAMPFIGVNFRTRMMFISGGDPPVFVELGAGLMAGVSMTVPQWPVEFFVEAGPVFAFWKGPGFGIDVDGLAGARLYF